MLKTKSSTEFWNILFYAKTFKNTASYGIWRNNLSSTTELWLITDVPSFCSPVWLEVLEQNMGFVQGVGVYLVREISGLVLAVCSFLNYFPGCLSHWPCRISVHEDITRPRSFLVQHLISYIGQSNVLVSLQGDGDIFLFCHYSPTTGIWRHFASSLEVPRLITLDRSIFHGFILSPIKMSMLEILLTMSCGSGFHWLINEQVFSFVYSKLPGQLHQMTIPGPFSERKKNVVHALCMPWALRDCSTSEGSRFNM